jgi:predicted GNAT family acetyltransferase
MGFMIYIVNHSIKKGTEIILKNKLHYSKKISGIYEDLTKNKVDSRYIYIAYDGDIPIGCALSSTNATAMVFISPKYRRKGLGTLLITKLCEENKKNYFLSVDKTSSKSKKHFWDYVKNKIYKC